MIKKRTSELMRVVSRHDSALRHISAPKFSEYLRTRDPSVIELDEKGMVKGGELATVFFVRPLPQENVQLLDQPGSVTNVIVFRNCVERVLNAGDITFTKDSDGVCKEFLDAIGQAHIDDIATVIMDQRRGRNGSDIPFTLPDGWRVERLESDALRATIASRESVKTNQQSGLGSEVDEVIPV